MRLHAARPCATAPQTPISRLTGQVHAMPAAQNRVLPGNGMPDGQSVVPGRVGQDWS